MRKILLATVLAGGLAACTATQVTSITTSLIDEADAIIVTSCNAYPEVTSLISLLNSGVAATANALAAAFCQAIQAAVPTPASSSAMPVALASRKKRLGLAAPVHVCTTNGICGWR